MIIISDFCPAINSIEQMKISIYKKEMSVLPRINVKFRQSLKRKPLFGLFQKSCLHSFFFSLLYYYSEIENERELCISN